MPKFSDVEDLIAAGTAAGPASDESIRLAEEALQTRFPLSYKVFLSRVGALFLRGVDIAGVFTAEDDDAPPLWANVVLVTLQLRRAARGMLPDEYVFISDDGADTKFFLDTSRINDQDECPIVACGPSAEGTIVASDVFDYIRRTDDGTLFAS